MRQATESTWNILASHTCTTKHFSARLLS